MFEQTLQKNHSVCEWLMHCGRIWSRNVLAEASTIELSMNSLPPHSLVGNHFVRETLYLLLQQIIGAGAPLLVLPVETLRMLPIPPGVNARLILRCLLLLSAGVFIGVKVAARRESLA